MSGASDVKDASPDEDLLEKNTANDSVTSSTNQSFLIGTLIPTIALGIIPFFLFFVAFINKLRRRTTRAVGPDVIEESLGASTSVLPLDTQVGTSRTVMVSADEVAEAPEPYYVEPEPEITTEDTTNNCKNNVINIDLDSTTQDRHIRFIFQFNDPCLPCTSGANKDDKGSDPKTFQGSFKYPQDGNKDGGQANVFFRGFISKNTDPNFKPLPPPPQRTECPNTSKAKSFPEPFQLQTSVSSPTVHNCPEQTPINTKAATGPEKITKIQQDLRPVVYKTSEVEDLSIPPPPVQCTPENKPNMAPADLQNLRTVVYKTDATVEEPPPANYRVDGESQQLETPRRTEQVAKPQERNAQLPSSNNAVSAVRPPPVQSAKPPQINEKAKQPTPSTHPESISNKTTSPLTSPAVNRPATTLPNEAKFVDERTPNAPEREAGKVQVPFNAAQGPNLSTGTPQVVEPVQQSANVEKIKPSENLEPVPATEKRPMENRAEVLQKITYKTIKTPEPAQISSAESPVKFTTSAPVVTQRSQPTEATKVQKEESSAKDPRPIAYATRQTPESLEPQNPANSEQPISQIVQGTASVRPNVLPASKPQKLASQANKNDVKGQVKGTAEEKKPLLANEKVQLPQPITQHESPSFPNSSKKAAQETKNIPVEKSNAPSSLVRSQDREADGPAGPTEPLMQPTATAEQRLPIVVDPQRPAEATKVHRPIIIDPQHPKELCI